MTGIHRLTPDSRDSLLLGALEDIAGWANHNNLLMSQTELSNVINKIHAIAHGTLKKIDKGFVCSDDKCVSADHHERSNN